MEIYMKQWQIQSRNNQSNDDHIIITKQNKTNKQTNKKNQNHLSNEKSLYEYEYDMI